MIGKFSGTAIFSLLGLKKMMKRTEYGAVECVAYPAVLLLSVSSYLSVMNVLSVYNRTYLCLFRKNNSILNILISSRFAYVLGFQKRSSEMQKGSFAIIRNLKKREFRNKRGVLELSDDSGDCHNGVPYFFVPFGEHVLSVFDRTYLCLFRNFSAFCNVLNFSALMPEFNFQKESFGMQKGSFAIIRNTAKREFYNKGGVLQSFIQLWQKKRMRRG